MSATVTPGSAAEVLEQTTKRMPTAWLWLLPGLLVIAVLFVVPFGRVYWTSLTNPVPGWQNYAEILTNSLYFRVLRNTVVSAFWTTLGCLLIGYPLAYAIFRTRGWVRIILFGSVLFAYAVGTVPRTFAWLVMLGDRGLVNQVWMEITGSRRPIPILYNQSGVLIGMIHVMLPFMTLLLLGAMARVSPNLVPAARTLGASPLRALWEVFIPQTRPGVIAGVMLIFIYSLGFYVVPAVLGGSQQTTIVMQIQSLVLTTGRWGLGAALAGLLAIFSVLGSAAYVRLTGLTDVYAND
jgi:putative spermidine/putrescine transport system permease protein